MIKAILLTIVLALAVANAQMTICDFYSHALNLTNNALVSSVVTGTVNKALASPNLAPFFNGETPAGSTNFTDPANVGAFNNLFGGLVSFFGAALGCSDGTIAPYTGPSLADAHAGQPITAADFDEFNGNLLSVLQGAGVVEADLITVGGVLNSTRIDICNNCPPPSICDYYSHVLGYTNLQLVSFVVNETVMHALASDLVVFFNGQVPEGSTNFADPANMGAFLNLFNGLVAFFGQALGCTDMTIPPYTGPSLVDAHAGQPINSTQFEEFNGFIIHILGGAGVTAADQNTVAAILESTRMDICNACPPPSICDKYSHALSMTNIDLISFVVNQTVMKALGSDLVVFFNGAVPEGSTNFADPANMGAFLNLFNGLVAFFGQALGCSDPTFPAYKGPTLTQAHAGQPINSTQFEEFNGFIISILKGAGVTQDDLNAVSAVLEGTRGEICNLCPAATTSQNGGTNGTTTHSGNSTGSTSGGSKESSSQNNALALAISLSFSLLVLA